MFSESWPRGPKNTPARGRAARRAGRPFRPRLEHLEDRLTPAHPGVPGQNLLASSVVRSALPTAFTNLNNLSIAAGTPAATVSGHLDGGGQLVPAGETVRVTLNGVTQNAALDGGDNFSTTFATAGLAPAASPYAVAYGYAGDAAFAAASATSRLTVNAVRAPTDQPPVARDDAATTTAGQTDYVFVLANDTEPDDGINPASIAVVGSAAHGQVTVFPGYVGYQPNAGFTGTDTFQYTVKDNAGNVSNAATVTVTVNPDLAPVARDDATTVAANSSSNPINVLANDTEPDDGFNANSIAIVSNPAHGTVDLTLGVSYTPNPGFTGVDTFKYTVADNGGRVSNAATVTVTVSSSTLEFTSLPSPEISEGTSSVQVFGQLTDPSTFTSPPAGETVTVSVGGSSASGTLDASGNFLVTVPTSSLTAAGSPYTLTYNYAGDGTFGPAGGTSALTVDAVARSNPSFANLSAPTISYGTASTAVGGQLSAFAGLQNSNVFQPAGSPWLPIGSDSAASGNQNLPSIILTVNRDGTVTLTKTANFSIPYDGTEDTYIGIINPAGSGVVLNTLTLTGGSGSQIFGFDADGIQGPGFSTPTNYTLPPAAFKYYDSTIYPTFGAPGTLGNPNGATGYEGPGTYFTGIDLNSSDTNFENTGTVNFDDGTGLGLLPGEQTYFSLEDGPSGITSGTGAVGSTVPANLAGETVSVTLNGVTQTATLDSNDNFTTTFATGSLGVAGSQYPIGFSYGGDSHFNPVTGSSTLTVQQATPTFSNLSAPTITGGTSMTAISGRLNANAGAQLVPLGETVQVTLNGVTQNAALDASDNFTTTFATGALTAAGSPYTIGFGYGGDANFTSASGTSSLTVTAGTKPTPSFSNLSHPTITFGRITTGITGHLNPNAGGPTVPAGETVQVTLNGVTHNATLDASDNFSTTFTTSTLGVAGSPYTLGFGYAGDANFNGATGSSTLAVVAATPVLSWTTPHAIAYGTPLSGTQLDATAEDPTTLTPLAGTFVYAPPAGTVLGAGEHTLGATFTASDATDYTTATVSAILEVAPAAPTFANLSAPTITFGAASTAVSGHLNANASGQPVPLGEMVQVTLNGVTQNATLDASDNFTTTFATGALGVAGSPYAIGFAYNGDANFSSASATSSLAVTKATPTISWATPADIPYGTALGSGQLDATAADPTTAAALAGTFAYVPPAGTVLGAGSVTLSVTFTPTDSADYTTAIASVKLKVDAATPTFANLSAPTITFGTASTAISGHLNANASGQPVPLGELVQVTLNGVTQNATLDASDNFTTTFATGALGVAGSPYAIGFGYAGDANFGPATGSSTLTVSRATPQVSVTGGTFTFDGQPHPATGSVSGVGGADLGTPAFSYTDSSNVTIGSPPVDLGRYTVTASFAGDANYLPASNTATITIVAPSANASMILLDATGHGALTDSGQGKVTAAGTVAVDSSDAGAVVVGGTATLTAPEFDVTGTPGTQVAGTATLTGLVKGGQTAAADPLAGLAAPIPKWYPAYFRTSIGGSQVVTLKPGTYYGGITIGGQAVVTLMPGVYYLKTGGLSVSGSAQVMGTGVLIYDVAAGSGDGVQIGGQASVSLTAATGGPYAGVAFFQARGSHTAVALTGGSLTVNGTLYAAGAAVVLSNQASLTATPTGTLPGLDAADLTVGDETTVNVNAPTPSSAAAVAGPALAGAASVGGRNLALEVWQQQGQAAILSLGGGPSSTALGAWLAGNFPRLFGGLAGQSNMQVDRAVQSAADDTRGQALAAALNVYATTYSLGGKTLLQNGWAARLGLGVTAAGGGAASYDVGANAGAFGPGAGQGTVVSLYQILHALDGSYDPAGGQFYHGNAALTAAAYSVLAAVN